MSKKVKNIIKYIILSGIVLVVAYFYSFVKIETVVQHDGVESDSTIARLFKYQFECDGNKLQQVKIPIRVKENGDGELKISFYEADGEKLIVSNELKSEEIDNNGYVVLKFDAIKKSDNKSYILNMETNTDSFCFDGQVGFTYTSVRFRLQTMIVFVLCIAYLVALSRTLSRIFRK